MKTLAFGTPMLVRAEIARIIGSHRDDIYVFQQKVFDARRYVRYPLDDLETWPGVAVPTDWAETPADWELEPTPNGNAVVRCRRIPLQTPAMGLYLGVTRIFEGTLVSNNDEARPWRKSDLVDKRLLRVYQVATTPVAGGQMRVALVHPHDAQPVPLTMTQLR